MGVVREEGQDFGDLLPAQLLSIPVQHHLLLTGRFGELGPEFGHRCSGCWHEIEVNMSESPPPPLPPPPPPLLASLRTLVVQVREAG